MLFRSATLHAGACRDCRKNSKFPFLGWKNVFGFKCSGVYGTPMVWNLPYQPSTQKVFINKCIQNNTNIGRHFTPDGSGQAILYVEDPTMIDLTRYMVNLLNL